MGVNGLNNSRSTRGEEECNLVHVGWGALRLCVRPVMHCTMFPVGGDWLILWESRLTQRPCSHIFGVLCV